MIKFFIGMENLLLIRFIIVMKINQWWNLSLRWKLITDEIYHCDEKFITDKIYHCDENLSLKNLSFWWKFITYSIYHFGERFITDEVFNCDKNLSLIKLIIVMKIYHWWNLSFWWKLIRFIIVIKNFIIVMNLSLW